MRRMSTKRECVQVRLSAVLMGSLVVALFASPAWAQWPQWGGPNGDFTTSSKGLAAKWPEDGPKQVWSRPLGAGYATILQDAGRLITSYRQGEDEFLVAMDPDTGKTIWEHKYAAPLIDGVEKQYGVGPRSTPVVSGKHVVMLGMTGRLTCLDKTNGKKLWSHDLVKEFGATSPYYGFASSPIVHRGTLILAAGGDGAGLMAFDVAGGSLLWKKHDFTSVYSSPVAIKVGGQAQLALLVDREIVGINPTDGEILWRHEHVNQWKTNINTPIQGPGGLLYVTSGGDAGMHTLKLTNRNGKTTVEEVWANKKMGVGQGTLVRIGDYLYGPAGGRAAALTAINAETGEIAWRERGYVKANIISADGKLIILDEDGTLTLATATPKGLTVRSKAAILKKKAWTAPSLIGTRLYLRDNETIVALDLSIGRVD